MPRKSDCEISYEPGDADLAIRLSSTVSALFGASIEATARSVARDFGVSTGILSLDDDGALDFCLAARIETALRESGFRRGDTAEAPAATRREDGALAVNRPVRRPVDGPSRRRRSRLYVPGDQPDMLPNAGLYGADCLILDLEDSVHPTRKTAARVLARRALEAHYALRGDQYGRGFFGDSEIIVRINPLSGPYGRDDLAELAPCLPDAILLPKCDSAEDVEELDSLLASLEAASGFDPGSTLVMPLIETARGVIAAPSIALASPRVCALCFGAEDFSRDIGARRSAHGGEARLARQAVVLAAKAAGVQAIDSVYSDTEDLAGFAGYCDEARGIGFDGVGLLHPRQIAVAHERFEPSADELKEAEAIVAALDAAAARGSGVASIGGKMIDAPVAARARRVLELSANRGRGSEL